MVLHLRWTQPTKSTASKISISKSLDKKYGHVQSIVLFTQLFVCRKFAPRCCVCKQPIMPEPGKEETVRAVALDRSFHIDCYKCEDCGLTLAGDGEGRGCYPLDDHILCKSCNAKRVQALTSVMTTELWTKRIHIVIPESVAVIIPIFVSFFLAIAFHYHLIFSIEQILIC